MHKADCFQPCGIVASRGLRYRVAEEINFKPTAAGKVNINMPIRPSRSASADKNDEPDDAQMIELEKERAPVIQAFVVRAVKHASNNTLGHKDLIDLVIKQASKFFNPAPRQITVCRLLEILDAPFPWGGVVAEVECRNCVFLCVACCLMLMFFFPGLYLCRRKSCDVHEPTWIN